MKLLKSIELEFCKVSLREDGLIENRFVWEDPYVIDVKELNEIKEAISELMDNQAKPILSVPGLYGSMTNEARKVDIFDQTGRTVAIGLVLRSLPQRLLANFYFKMKRVPYPIQFFNSEDKAVEWLSKIKES